MRALSGQALAAIVLLTAAAMNLLSRGAAESFPVFLVALEQSFQVDRVALTGIYSTYMLVYGLAAPGTGYLIDRFGARLGYTSGLVLLTLAFGLSSQATALWHLYILLGVLTGMGTAALGMVPSSTIASAWFDKRLPSAMSLLYASLGIGVLIFSPFSSWLIESLGWREAYFWLGGVPLLALPLMVMLPWRRIQAGAPEVMATRHARQTASDQRSDRRAELLEALKTKGFWKLAGVMFFTTISTFTVQIQLVAFLVDTGFEPLFAATTFGLVGLLSTVGMIGTGVIAERYGERNIATFAYLCSIAGAGCLALLTIWPNLLPLILFVILFGSVSGSRGPLVAVYSSRLFAGAAQATIYGFVLLAMGIGGAVAGWVGGVLHDATGGYVAGFALSALGALAGMLLFRSIDTGPKVSVSTLAS
ncbi:MAG: MFS transporter [Burkholderiaceae bacterium]